ncbi:hypothetical protein MHU86_7889 [Fragilaria crotonensis]|nr:hypothetical protein MHU86_7889 [Fragilaria crotonensis]
MISFLLDGGSKSILSQLLRNLHYVHVASKLQNQQMNISCAVKRTMLEYQALNISFQTKQKRHHTYYVVAWWLKASSSGTPRELANDFHPNLASFPHHMREAITKVARHQSSIGWDNVQKGYYLSKAWADLAAFDNIHESKYDVPRAHMRLRRLVKAIHVYTRSLWTCWNEKLHSRQSSEAETVWSTSQAEIRHFYFKRDLVSFEDQHLFRFSLDHLLRSSRSTQIRWLRCAKASSKPKRVERNSQTLITGYSMPVPQET